MNKEEIIGKLQMVYVGDTNALNELIGYYDGLKQGIEELQQENQKYKEVIDKAINSIDILQEIIYQQPTNNSADDLWLLDKLDGIKNILKEVE